jgi:hypothetical protein
LTKPNTKPIRSTIDYRQGKLKGRKVLMDGGDFDQGFTDMKRKAEKPV